jgi:MFS family permease
LAGPTPALGKGRAALLLLFFANGFIYANWAARIPQIKTSLALDDARFGAALLGYGLGALLSMPLTSLVVHRRGSRTAVRAAAIAFCAALSLPGLATSQVQLALALVLFGGANGALDISMNTHGVVLERRLGFSVMQSMHGAYSGGLLLGGAVGALAAAAGVAPSSHLVVAAALLATAAGLGSHWLVRETVPPPQTEPDRPARSFPVVLVILALTAVCASFVEASVANWSGVYLAESLGTSPGIAAGGFLAFSVALTLGRLAGDRLTRRVGHVAVVRVGAAGAAAGLAAGLALGTEVANLAGFALAGLGLGCVFPTVIVAAGRVPGVASAIAIAFVSTVGYLAGMAGPPLIGAGSERFGLPTALWLLVGAATLIALLAAAVRTATPPPQPAGPPSKPSRLPVQSIQRTKEPGTCTAQQPCRRRWSQPACNQLSDSCAHTGYSTPSAPCGSD